VAYRDWQLQDPAGQPLDVVRQIRDDIAARVRALIEELLPIAESSAQPRPRLARDSTVAVEFANGAQQTCIEHVRDRHSRTPSDSGDF
jgi:hypothetical protein